MGTRLRSLAVLVALIAAAAGCSAPAAERSQDPARSRPPASGEGARPSSAPAPGAPGSIEPAAPPSDDHSAPASSAPDENPHAAASGLEPWPPLARSQAVLRGPAGQEIVVPVYVAATPAERAQGLMGRASLPADAGMLFLFPADSRSIFWMRGTSIPLSIGFFAADGRLVQMLDLQPCEADPCSRYVPDVDYRTALEVNRGFFEAQGVDKRWSIALPEGLPEPR